MKSFAGKEKMTIGKVRNLIESDYQENVKVPEDKLSRFLELLGNLSVEIEPITSTTNKYISRCLAGAAVGSGLVALAVLSGLATGPFGWMIAAGALIGAGAGYFSPSFRIRIKISPPDRQGNHKILLS